MLIKIFSVNFLLLLCWWFNCSGQCSSGKCVSVCEFNDKESCVCDSGSIHSPSCNLSPCSLCHCLLFKTFICISLILLVFCC